MLGRPGQPYCVFCGEPLTSQRPCPDVNASGGRDCAQVAEVLPRSMAPSNIVGDPCMLCGAPVFDKVYFYQCPGHQNGGWCFTEAEFERLRRDIENRRRG